MAYFVRYRLNSFLKALTYGRPAHFCIIDCLGPYTYYLISRGEFSDDYGRYRGLAVDYVTNNFIFTL